MNLIEVLISLFILSFSLLSLNALQLSALKQTQAIYYFTQAEQRVNLWLNHPDKESYWPDWQAENQAYLPTPESTLSKTEIIIKWGSFQKECQHSIIEKSGCINIPIMD